MGNDDTRRTGHDLIKRSDLAATKRGEHDATKGNGGGPPRGLFGLGRLKYDAWRTEVECAAELRILDCRQQLTEKRQALALAELNGRNGLALAEMNGKLALAQAEMDGRRRLLLAALEAEELEGELALQRRLVQSPPERRLQVLGAEVETQRLMLEREQLRRQRLSAPPSLLPPALPAPAGPLPGPALLEQHVGDRQIEALALRAVTRFSVLDPSEAEREWARWRQELSARLPAYAADEVARRADELRELAG